MEKENTLNEPTNAMPYEALLCPFGLFLYFIRKQYKGIEITNEQCDSIRIGFAKYLHELNLTDNQKKNILPKSEIDVILSNTHPFRMHGFSPAYVYHFAEYVEQQKQAYTND